MTTVRKTESQILDDSYFRGTTEPIMIYEFDENHVMVFNEKSNGEYLIEIDKDNEIVIDCTCPHKTYRLSLISNSLSCKHMIAVAMYLGYRY